MGTDTAVFARRTSRWARRSCVRGRCCKAVRAGDGCVSSLRRYSPGQTTHTTRALLTLTSAPSSTTTPRRGNSKNPPHNGHHQAHVSTGEDRTTAQRHLRSIVHHDMRLATQKPQRMIQPRSVLLRELARRTTFHVEPLQPTELTMCGPIYKTSESSLHQPHRAQKLTHAGSARSATAANTTCILLSRARSTTILTSAYF